MISIGAVIPAVVDAQTVASTFGPVAVVALAAVVVTLGVLLLGLVVERPGRRTPALRAPRPPRPPVVTVARRAA